MNSRNFSGQQMIHFRKWSRKGFAIFNSLNKTIKIGRLNLAFSILTLSVSGVLAQSNQQPFIDQDVDLDELEVTAEAEPLVFSQGGRVITTIRKKEIQSAAVNDLAGLLSYVQSVDIRQRGGMGMQADVSIRGGSFDQVLVLLNGIPISDPQTGHFNLNIPVDFSDIEKVEILKGPGARIFGPNAFSGAINIITKTPEASSLNIRALGGQNALYHYGASLHTSIKNWQTAISYDQKGSDGYMENTDFKSYNAYLHSKLQMSKLLLTTQLGFLQKAFGANSFYSPKYPLQYEKNQSYMASMGILFGKKLRISIRPYFREHRDNWQLTRENPDIYQNFHQTRVYGSRLKAITYSLFGKTSLGISIKSENLLSSSMGEKMNNPIDIPWAINHQFTHQYHRNHGGIYLEQSKSFHTKWTLTAGLLSHWYSGMKTAIDIYPGADISFQPTHKWKLFASANNAMRLPTFTDLFYSGPSNMGNQYLNPEKSLTFEIGSQYQNQTYRLEAVLFRRYGTDIIDWVWQDSIWQTQNINRLSTNGIELSAEIQPSKLFNIKWWKKISIDYTYLDLIKEESEIQSKYALNNLRHQVNIIAQFQILKHLHFQLQSRYQDRIGFYQDYNFENKSYTKHPYGNYFLIDAQISWSKNAYRFYMKAHNIGNIDYVEYGVPQSGFWLMGGFNYQLKL